MSRLPFKKEIYVLNRVHVVLSTVTKKGVQLLAAQKPVKRQGWGHYVVNVFHLMGGFSICKTAHRIWPRILFIALEQEINVLNCG